MNREVLKQTLMAALDELAPHYRAAEGDPEYRAELLDSVVRRLSQLP